MRAAAAALCTLCIAGPVAVCTPARAQVDWTRLKESVVPAEEEGALPKKSAPKPKAAGLFDAGNTTVGLELDAGPVWYRTRGQPLRLGVVELGAGQTTTAATEHAYLAGSLRTVLRAFDSKTTLWTLLQLGFASGVKAGPIELEAQIGLGLLGISAARAEWSLDLLSPRVGVAAALHAGRFRLALGAHTEYLWRLFGMGYTARGLTISFRFDLAPALPKLTASREPVGEFARQASFVK